MKTYIFNVTYDEYLEYEAETEEEAEDMLRRDLSSLSEADFDIVCTGSSDDSFDED